MLTNTNSYIAALNRRKKAARHAKCNFKSAVRPDPPEKINPGPASFYFLPEQPEATTKRTPVFCSNSISNPPKTKPPVFLHREENRKHNPPPVAKVRITSVFCFGSLSNEDYFFNSFLGLSIYLILIF